MSKQRSITRANGSWHAAKAARRYARTIAECLVRAHCGGKLPRFARPKTHVIIEVYPDEVRIVSAYVTERALRIYRTMAGL